MSAITRGDVRRAIINTVRRRAFSITRLLTDEQTERMAVMVADELLGKNPTYEELVESAAPVTRPDLIARLRGRVESAEESDDPWPMLTLAIVDARALLDALAALGDTVPQEQHDGLMYTRRATEQARDDYERERDEALAALAAERARVDAALAELADLNPPIGVSTMRWYDRKLVAVRAALKGGE